MIRDGAKVSPFVYRTGFGAVANNTMARVIMEAPTITRAIHAPRTRKWLLMPTRKSTEARNIVVLT